MGDTILLAICIVLVIEGLMPLLIPHKWKQFLMQMALQPSESLRRIGGVMVVIGGLSAYFLMNRI